MRLGVGDRAPDFTEESVNKGAASLRDYRGDRVLLAFGRYFGCPVCQLEFDELVEQVEADPSLRILYVTQSSPESARAYLSGNPAGFPVIPAARAGDGYPLYDLYGVGKMGPLALLRILQKAGEAKKLGKRHGAYEGIETQSPAQFLIGGDGKILSANYGLFEPEKLR